MYLISYERQDMKFMLYRGLAIFLAPLLLVHFSTLGALISIRQTKLNSLEDFFVQDPSRLAIILSLLTLGIQASLT
jgi:hypothetical protein